MAWIIQAKEHQNYIIPSDQTGFSVRDDEGKELLFLRDDKVNDIGLLVRLKINEKKTVHLIFGTGKRGTMAALNYITNYSEEIFLKHNTKNYFLMLWSNYTNYSIDFSKGITDLSEYLHD